MSKKTSKKRAKKTKVTEAPEPTYDDINLIPFDEPDTALNAHIVKRSNIVFHQLEYYQPTISKRGLAQLIAANEHHSRQGYMKTSTMCRYYVDNDTLPLDILKKSALDYNFLGECYLQVILNVFDQVIGYEYLPSVYMRRMPNNHYCYVQSYDKIIKFKPNEVIHLYQHHPLQQLYGVPHWFAATNSVLLSEAAILNRLRYFHNGHSGFILVSAGARLSPKDKEKITKKVRQMKGVNGFKSMYLNIEKGNADSIKVIHLGDAVKDDFEKIAKGTADFILSAWGMFDVTAAAMADNNTQLPNLNDVELLNYRETIDVQQAFLSLNKNHQDNPIQFNKPEAQS